MRRWPALLLAATVLLAGCSDAIGTGGDRPTPTVTPAPLPATATPAATTIPGIADGRVADPLALANAHAAGLDGRSYMLDSTWTVRYENGSLRAFVDLHSHVDEPAFLARMRVDGPDPGIVADQPASAVFWSDGRELVERVERDDRTTYLHVPAAEYNGGSGFYNSLKRPTPWHDTYGLFAAVDLRVVGDGREEDTAIYRLAGERLRDPSLFAATTGTDRPRNVTFRAAVDEHGVVRSQHLSYTAEVGDETVHVTRVVRYHHIGETTVTKPEWYEQAKNESVRDAPLEG